MSSHGTSDRQAHQLERLIFFSDAVFAIAITLLVIEVHVPDLPQLDDALLGQALVDLLPKYIGFLSSFFVIGRFWVGHHQLFGMLKASDNRLVWINLVLLMTIAFMPFPTAVFSDYVRLRVGVGLYTVWLMVVGLANFWLVRTAIHRRHLIRDEVTNDDCRAALRNSTIPILIGFAAFVAGMIEPLLSLVALAAASPVIALIVRRTGRAHRITPG